MSDQRATRRGEILEAACLEFSEKGFAGARIEEIARKAGIGKSTVYEYFPSKLDLLEGAADWMLDRIANDVTALMRGAMPFAGKIREYLLYMCRMLQKIGPGMIYMQGSKEDMIKIMRRCSTRFFGVISDAVADAVREAKESGELRPDADTAAIAQIVCYLPSPSLAAAIEQGNLSMVDDMVDLLLRGFAARSE